MTAVSQNYYLHPAVSNSDLSSLMLAYYSRERGELEDIFNFGSLVDALLTEPHKVNFIALTLTEDGGKVIRYDPAVFAQGVKLAEACRRDPLIVRFLDSMVGQYVFIRSLVFDYQGEDFTIFARCKFDLFSKRFATGLDFKTTACPTLKAFIAAVDFFDWDRQAAWYMDLARIDRHWIIGISKKTGEIFKYAIQRGDETYNRGRAKYSVWAYRWLVLVEPFKIPTNEICKI